MLGAGVGTIVLLFTWRFSKPVLVANLFAWPAAVWIMLRWLQRFPEQIDYALLLPICLVATVATLRSSDTKGKSLEDLEAHKA